MEYPRYERETEFFGFHPMKLVDSIVNTVNDHACNAVDELEIFLRNDKSVMETTENSREKVKKAADLVLEKWQSGIDEFMDKLEVYVMRNIFAVPNDIVLLSRENPLFVADPVPAESVSALDNELISLWKSLKSQVALRHRLAQHEATWDRRLSVISNSTDLVQMLQQFSAIVSGHRDVAFDRKIEENVSQAEVLIAMHNADVVTMGTRAENAKMSIADNDNNTAEKIARFNTDEVKALAAAIRA